MTEIKSVRKVDFEISDNLKAEPINENFSANRSVAKQIASLDLEAISDAVADVIDRMAGYIKPHEGGPSQCEVEFAVKVTAEGNIVISKLGGEVSLKVKVTWTR